MWLVLISTCSPFVCPRIGDFVFSSSIVSVPPASPICDEKLAYTHTNFSTVRQTLYTSSNWLLGSFNNPISYKMVSSSSAVSQTSENDKRRKQTLDKLDKVKANHVRIFAFLHIHRCLLCTTLIPFGYLTAIEAITDASPVCPVESRTRLGMWQDLIFCICE